MATTLPSRKQIKLLCHFDQDTADVSIYQRVPAVVGRSTYKNGSNYSKFGYSVYTLGPSSGTRYDGRVVIDISDVDLSGQFCIDYWFRTYGTYTGTHWAMTLNDPDDTSRPYLLSHCCANNTTNGFYTYDPVQENVQFYRETRDTKIHHVAVTRDANNVLRWFYDGVLQVSYNNSFDFSSPELWVSQTYSNGTGAYIAIDELRVVSGYPCYTADFTPPTAAYTIPDAIKYPFLYDTAKVL